MDGKIFEDLVGLPQVAHIKAFCPFHTLPAPVLCDGLAREGTIQKYC